MLGKDQLAHNSSPERILCCSPHSQRYVSLPCRDRTARARHRESESRAHSRFYFHEDSAGSLEEDPIQSLQHKLRDKSLNFMLPVTVRDSKNVIISCP